MIDDADKVGMSVSPWATDPLSLASVGSSLVSDRVRVGALGLLPLCMFSRPWALDPRARVPAWAAASTLAFVRVCVSGLPPFWRHFKCYVALAADRGEGYSMQNK